MNTPTPEYLEACVGQTAVVVQDTGACVVMTLKRVRRMAKRDAAEDLADDLAERDNASDATQQFSIDLRGPVDPVLAPMTYPVTLPGLDPMHLFVSPYHQDASETFYEIVMS